MALQAKTKKQQEHVLAILKKRHTCDIDPNDCGLYIEDFITYDDMAEIVDYLRESKNKYPELFEKCWEAYRRKGQKKTAKAQWDKLKESEFEMVMPHIKAYVSSRDVQYQKDFERYLRDRVFLEVVYSGNNIIYDPTKAIAADKQVSVYVPTCGGMLNWNDYYKCYIYTGFWDGHIADGYSDDNRPNGAKVTLNNSRGTVEWNADKKEWKKV